MDNQPDKGSKMKTKLQLVFLNVLIIIWLVIMQEFIAALVIFLGWIIGIIISEAINGRRRKHDKHRKLL
jgi:multisubunit Na+/H+ antiporter MnhE subunit